MSAASRPAGIYLLICAGLASCGGGSEGTGEPPVNVDYTGLKIAEARETPLAYARNEEDLLLPLRNGLRMAIGSVPASPAGPYTVGAPSADAATQLPYSGTTVQVDGVDEADSLKYDGRYLFTVRPESTVPVPLGPHVSRNVLSIALTNPETAGVVPISKFVIEGEQSLAPELYQLRSDEGAAEFIVAVSNNLQGWFSPQPRIAALVATPDRTTIQLLDVRDPHNVSEAWKLEIDGWMRASRMIGDTLYLVNSYRPRLPNLVLPADTLEKREANERRIRSSSAADLLPGYRENGAAKQPLTNTDGCLVIQQLESDEGYTDLLVISAINLRTRRVADSNCLSTNINGVYMSRESLYVAGMLFRSGDAPPITVLHKFALDDGDISYRATGSVSGIVAWNNPSYFMDEHEGDLRILTTANRVHRLTVLREAPGQNLAIVSSIPNAARPEPIGKPDELIYATRFLHERAYIVTFRTVDPLYVIDLSSPTDPYVAGALEIPGFSTYLRPLQAGQRNALLAVGQNVGANGLRQGVKVQLFDVQDISHPRLIGEHELGKHGSSTEALSNPHALTFLTLPGAFVSHRLALPINVFETPHPTQADRYDWTWSGLHMLEVATDSAGAPQLRFQGAIRTEEATNGRTSPSFPMPNRGVLHGDSVYAVYGETIHSSLWQNLR